ncbi:hypothetical protein Tco_0292131 [Tanacetum coccineum]
MLFATNQYLCSKAHGSGRGYDFEESCAIVAVWKQFGIFSCLCCTQYLSNLPQMEVKNRISKWSLEWMFIMLSRKGSLILNIHKKCSIAEALILAKALLGRDTVPSGQTCRSRCQKKQYCTAISSTKATVEWRYSAMLCSKLCG